MDREDIKLLPLVAVGLTKGVFECYIKPIPGDMLRWAVRGLLEFDIPDQEEIDLHISEVSKL